ncbi:MAG: tetratricopeptide repeat protein [Burkholderiales bacterium]
MIALVVLPVAVRAAGGDSDATPADPVIAAAQKANGQNDFTKSAAILREALVKSPDNADYHNLYAYAIRKGPNPNMDEAFQHYNEALRLNPKHLGANEYLGEAYLTVGNLPRAREQLAKLDKLCFFGCDEYTKLKTAIADYEEKHKP